MANSSDRDDEGSRVRSLLAPVALLSIGIAGGACGGSTNARSRPHPAVGASSSSVAHHVDPAQEVPRYPGVKAYPDDDDEDNDHNGDENIRGFGREADAATGRAMVATLERYYTAAAKRDGARACGMLALSLRAAVPITYGRYGARYMRGDTCTAVLSHTFEYLHAQIASEAARMKVIAARVEGEKGYVVVDPHARCVPSTCVLALHELHIAKLLMGREAGSWKVESILLKV
jgi:hypothetical protein